MGKFYKKDGEDWIGDISTAETKDFLYTAEDFTKDEDLLDGWIFRLEPPTEYLDWLKNQENAEDTIIG